MTAEQNSVEPLDLIAGSMSRAALEETGFSEKRLAAALAPLLAAYGATALRLGDPIRKAQSESEWLALHMAALRCRCYLASGKTIAWIGLPQTIFAALFDCYYGGAGEAAGATAHLTAAERRFAERLAGDLAQLPVKGWAGDKAITVAGFNLSFGDDPPVTPHDGGGLAVIEIPVGDAAAISVAITTECIASMRTRPAEAGRKGARPDGEWRRQLLDRASDVRLPVRSVLARPEIPAAQLMTLKPGDCLPLTIPQTVPVTVGKYLLAHGTMGETQGCVAIRIESIAKGPNP